MAAVERAFPDGVANHLDGLRLRFAVNTLQHLRETGAQGSHRDEPR
jgi:hypothetical protein